MTEDAVVVEGLEKSYGSVRALCGVDFAARTGSVLGLLGPNGAGKTTAVRILTTVLAPTGGQARVLGPDVVRDLAAGAARSGPRGGGGAGRDRPGRPVRRRRREPHRSREPLHGRPPHAPLEGLRQGPRYR